MYHAAYVGGYTGRAHVLIVDVYGEALHDEGDYPAVVSALWLLWQAHSADLRFAVIATQPVDRDSADGELTLEQGAELRDALRRQYAGGR